MKMYNPSFDELVAEYKNRFQADPSDATKAAFKIINGISGFVKNDDLLNVCMHHLCECSCQYISIQPKQNIAPEGVNAEIWCQLRLSIFSNGDEVKIECERYSNTEIERVGLDSGLISTSETANLIPQLVFDKLGGIRSRHSAARYWNSLPVFVDALPAIMRQVHRHADKIIDVNLARINEFNNKMNRKDIIGDDVIDMVAALNEHFEDKLNGFKFTTEPEYFDTGDLIWRLNLRKKHEDGGNASNTDAPLASTSAFFGNAYPSFPSYRFVISLNTNTDTPFWHVSFSNDRRLSILNDSMKEFLDKNAPNRFDTCFQAMDCYIKPIVTADNAIYKAIHSVNIEL